jgi:hypothetical protein
MKQTRRPGYRAARVLTLLLCVAALRAEVIQTNVQLSTGWCHEPGVESKQILTLAAAHPVHPRITVAGGIRASLFEHNGITRYGLSADFKLSRFLRLGLLAGVHHAQWNDWRVGENVALAALHAFPLPRLRLEAGIARRVPVFDLGRFASPFYWSGPMTERNLVYGIDWRFIDRPGLRVSTGTGNRARLRLYTPHHIRLRLDADARLARDWNAGLRCGTTIKGLSALLFEPGGFTAELEIRRAF